MKKIVILTIVIFLVTALYGYTQFLKKGQISAVLQYQIDLKNPPNAVFAISTSEQKSPDGKNIPKGTRFIGMLSKENEDLVIYFNTIQNTDGKTNQISAKSSLKVKVTEQKSGVSSKIGKTLYQQTKTNVLGAIFNNPNSTNQLPSSILPRGSALSIEID